MSAGLIVLILNIALGVFLLLGFLVGLARGVKKSAIKTGLLIGFLALFFFLSPLISKAITGIYINDNVGTIGTFLESQIKNVPEIFDVYANNQSLQGLVAALPAMLINIVIMFMLVPIALSFSAIVGAIISKTQKKNKKANKYDKVYTIKNGAPVVVEQLIKTPKHRFWGGLIGIIGGFAIFFCLFMPITATTRTVMQYINPPSTAIASAEGETFEYSELSNYIKSALGDEVIGYVNAINGSIFSKVASVGNIDLALYDTITTAKINGHNLNLRKELHSVANVVEAYLYVTNTTDENGKINIEKLNLNKIEKAADAVLKSTILQTVGAELVEYYINEALNGTILEDALENNLIHEKHVNLIKLILTPLSESLEANGGFEKQIKTDVSAIIDGAKAVINSGLIQDMEGFYSINKASVLTAISCLEGQSPNAKKKNYNYLNDIISAVFESETIKCALVGGFNYVLDELKIILEKELVKQGETITQTNAVVFDKAKLEGINAEETEENLIFVINKAVAGIKLYCNNLDSSNTFNLEMLLNAENFDEVVIDAAEALDLLKTFPLFTQTQNQNNILFQVINQSNRLDMINQFVDFSNQNISWKSEVQIVLPALKLLNQTYADNSNTQTLLQKILDGGAENVVETDGFKNLSQQQIQTLTTSLCESEVLRPLAVVMLEEINKNVATLTDTIFNPEIDKNQDLTVQAETISGVLYYAIMLLNIDCEGELFDVVLESENVKTTLKNLVLSLQANAQQQGVFVEVYQAIGDLLERKLDEANAQIVLLVDENYSGTLNAAAEEIVAQFDGIFGILSKVKEVASFGQMCFEDIMKAGGTQAVVEMLEEMQNSTDGVFGGAYNTIFDYFVANYGALNALENTTSQTVVWADVIDELNNLL